MDLLHSFQESIKSTNLFSSKDRLLLAVSGGIDSTVLCELCKQSGYTFIIAHCNFQLRGEESERDEQFVRSLGKMYEVEVLVKKFDTEAYAMDKKVSIQVAARELRYEWFASLINIDKKADCLLTAHHADDNIETMMMNFFRGTGLHGMTGMPSSSAHIRRPLLELSKEAILTFAKENDIDFREDSSNQSSKYTRNFIRNEVVPLVEKKYPEVKSNLQDTINRFKDIELLYKLTTRELIQKLCKTKGEEIHIPVKQLLSYNNKALIFEIIAPYGFFDKQVDEVIKLADSESGRYVQSPQNSHRIIRNRHWFIISPVKSEEAEIVVIDEHDKLVSFGGRQLQLNQITNNQQPTTNNNIAVLDAKSIEFPLILRKWKQGDYFYPLGMKKKKKVSRFFIDQKLSKTDKEKAWVLEMDKKIIWVVGMRIDERFKVTNKTKEVFELSLR